MLYAGLDLSRKRLDVHMLHGFVRVQVRRISVTQRGHCASTMRTSSLVAGGRLSLTTRPRRRTVNP
jgi:hypothetical protein